MQEVLTFGPGPVPRRCLVHLPPAAGAAPLPAVLILHGAGGTATWTLDETGWDATADRAGFVAVLPEGARADPTRPPGFLQNPQAWNAGAPQRLPDQPDVDDVAFLDAVLDELPRRYPLDPRRVFVTGFSNGAGMAFRLGAERSERFAALAPVAGHCWQVDPHPTRALPTLYLVGDADPLVPLEGGEVVSPWGGVPTLKPPVSETVARWAAALGCPPAPARREQGDGLRTTVYGPGRDGAELVVTVVEGLGHHWPGGRGQLSRQIAGPPSPRPRANELIWDFFRDHSS
jgi:polyhydroxybutyrate depolymerase